MIIDLFSSKFAQLSQKFHLRSWQSGILEDTISSVETIQSALVSGAELSMDRHIVRSINMGRAAGHTYVAQIAALREFPVRTKVYVSRKSSLGEFRNLLFNPASCHELVDVFHEDEFSGYNGQAVGLVIIDMSSETTRRFFSSFQALWDTIPTTTVVLILQAAV